MWCLAFNQVTRRWLKSPSPIQQFKWAGESWAARYCPSNPFVGGGDGVQSFSHFRLFATPWTAVRQASLFFSISQSLLKLRSIESVMPSNHLILCCLLLLPSVFPSIRVFSNELAVHTRCPKFWGFNFSISPSNEYSELISFRIDWFDLPAIQGTLKNLLQHHSLKASIFHHSVFLMVQLLYPSITTGKTVALTIRPLSAKWCLYFLICCLGLS